MRPLMMRYHLDFEALTITFFDWIQYTLCSKPSMGWVGGSGRQEKFLPSLIGTPLPKSLPYRLNQKLICFWLNTMKSQYKPLICVSDLQVFLLLRSIHSKTLLDFMTARRLRRTRVIHQMKSRFENQLFVTILHYEKTLQYVQHNLIPLKSRPVMLVKAYNMI